MRAHRYFRLTRLPRDVGTVPVSLLFWRSLHGSYRTRGGGQGAGHDWMMGAPVAAAFPPIPLVSPHACVPTYPNHNSLPPPLTRSPRYQVFPYYRFHSADSRPPPALLIISPHSPLASATPIAPFPRRNKEAIKRDTRPVHALSSRRGGVCAHILQAGQTPKVCGHRPRELVAVKIPVDGGGVCG